MGKTKFLAKVSISARYLYERAQHFLQSDPGLQHMANEFTPEMFTVEGIEVLGTPIGTESYIKNFVTLKNAHTVYECKYYFTVTGAFFVGAAAPY
jgi:hypothetical protein